MRIRINPQTLEWLYDHRVFFDGLRTNGSRLKPGELLSFFPNARVEPYSSIYTGHVIWSIGAFSYSHSSFPFSFSLGRYCSVAWNVRFPSPRHPLELISTSSFMMGSPADMWTTYLGDVGAEYSNLPPNPQKEGTAIGHDVWIGQDTTIMRGLRIGNGAVIAASAVVTKDVEPFAIVGGNPAKFLRWRFPEDIRTELTELGWWNYGYNMFEKINLADIRATIKELRQILPDTPRFSPQLIDLTAMPHSGLV